MYARAVGIKIGVIFASDLFAADLRDAAYRKFSPNTMLGICVTGALGLYFHTCQSPTLLNCFGQVMHNLRNRVALTFFSFDFSIPQSLVQTLESGIVFTLAIVGIAQG